MIVKKFQAPTETEAVLKARDELGSSAVVLNVKTLKQRGIFRLFRKDMVEITAAQEENEGAGEKSRTSFDEIAGDVLADTDMPPQEGPAAAYTPSGYAPRVSKPVSTPRPAGAYQPSSQVSAADTAASDSLKIQCRPFAAVQCPASSHPVRILKWHLLLHKGLRPVPQPLTLGLL